MKLRALYRVTNSGGPQIREAYYSVLTRTTSVGVEFGKGDCLTPKIQEKNKQNEAKASRTIKKKNFTPLSSCMNIKELFR